MKQPRQNLPVGTTGNADPRLKLPAGTTVIQCASGPVFTLMLTAGTPEDLRTEILKAAVQIESPLRELVRRADEIDTVLDDYQSGDNEHRAYVDLEDLRKLLREIKRIGANSRIA